MNRQEQKKKFLENLKKQLPKISDMKLLIMLLEDTSAGSEAEKLAKNRTVEVLKTILNMNLLTFLRKSTSVGSVGSEPRKLIEDRMAEVSKDNNLRI